MQNQALSALLFLYKAVLGQPLPWLDDLVHAQGPKRLPVVLARDEVQAILSRLTGTPRLMATLLYGGGLRVLECAQLRVKDLDFPAHQMVVQHMPLPPTSSRTATTSAPSKSSSAIAMFARP